MGVRFDRLRYEVFQNLFLSPMNTGSVRPAVLQQHLPLAVLKQHIEFNSNPVADLKLVATTPTACGIETPSVSSLQRAHLRTCCNNTYRLRY